MARILCCDDEEEALVALKQILESFGYETHAVSSVDRLIVTLRSMRFDLVLLDYNMPGRDGFSALEEIRRSFSPLEVPVVFLSAMQNKDQIVDLVKLGISGFLVKPPVFQTLNEKIVEFLAVRLSHDNVRDMLRSGVEPDPLLGNDPSLRGELGVDVKFYLTPMLSGREYVLVKKGQMAASMMATSNDLYIEKFCAVYGRFGKQWARVWPTYWMRNNAE